MSSLIDSLRPTAWSRFLLVGFALIIAVMLGALVAIWGIGTRELVIFTLVVLTVIVVAIPSDRILRLGFALWIFTFGFGWRTIYLAPNLTIHPSEVLAVLLFFAIALQSLVYHQKVDFSIPPVMLLLVAWSVIGIVVGVMRGNPIDVVLHEFKIFFVAIPSYYVVKHLIASRRDWERAILLSILVAVYISGLGLMDVFAPDLTKRLQGESVETIRTTITGFDRAGFLFYGHVAAGLVVFTFFGVTVRQLVAVRSNGWIRLIWGSALMADLFAMYLSGFRGLWYAMVVFLIAYAFVQKRSWVLLVLAALAIPFLPSAFMQRFESLYNLQYADSSQFKRIDRVTAAFDLLKENPLLGVGWGGSGYVHSDLIQIGANLGILGLGLFSLWIVHLIWRMFQLTRQSGWIGESASGLFATFCGLAVIFAGEGVIVWAQLTVPIWFLFAMGYKLDELARSSVTPNFGGTLVAKQVNL
ncbi:MAG: O-antigen ligase family protein [Chloroflexi bacterium]|nr:O-antigen ligase family protein [Chloroflexota bacterium]